MSLEKYIKDKNKLIKIVGMNLNEYSNYLREQLLSIKDRKHIYAEMLDIPRISSVLNSIGYNHVNGMIFDIGNPGDPRHRSEYPRFVEWCKLSPDSSVRKIHETISNLRSFYFIDEDVTLQDIEMVIDEKCILMTEKFTVIADAIRSERRDWDSELMMMEAERDGKIKAICDDGSVSLDYKDGNILAFPSETLSHDCSIVCELIKNHGEMFGTYFFTAKKSQRYAIQDSVRKMYLGKPHQPLKYGMSMNLPIETSDDIWRMVVKNRDVRYQFGAYRMLNESIRPRIVQLESK